ncbi:hypothetical protein PSEUDO9AG_40018 [Pseudomonas sp. 9Ag]|nr:hypothetical protein PSEUDO9AG_40018 [Pseudomonas sp. 9Ag]
MFHSHYKPQKKWPCIATGPTKTGSIRVTAPSGLGGFILKPCESFAAAESGATRAGLGTPELTKTGAQNGAVLGVPLLA